MEGEQERQKIKSAQEILHKATESVEKGTVGSTKEVSEALSRVQDTLHSQAQTAPDLKSEKTVSDMAKLVGSAEQVVVDKDIGDRLQRISKEAELAQAEGKRATREGVPGSQESMRQQTQILANNFGPFFQLVTSSHEFRRLVLGFVKIARRVFLRSIKEDVGSQLENQWLKGRNPAEIAKDVTERATSGAKNDQGQIEIAITEEEIEDLQENLLELFSVIARDPRYHEGISRLFDLSEMIYEETEPVSQKLQSAVSQPHTQKLQQESKELISEFTGKEALERFLQSARILARSLRNDRDASQYLRELREFILETKDPQHVKSEQFKNQSRNLIERGRRITDQLRYKPEVEEFLNALDALFNNLKDDELLATLRERAGILVEDLTTEDSQGNRQLDTQVLGNIRKVIVPVLADAFKYIPIPRFEDSNYKREYVIENLVLCGYDIIPDNIFVHLESDSWISVRELETQLSHTRLVISLKNLRTEIKDIKFYYKRKQFPKMEESGMASLRIGGRGASLTITFRVDQRPGETAPKFTSGHVDFSIDDMDIDFDRSTLTHDILVPMITTLFKQTIIHAIERGVEKNLGTVVNEIGRRLSESVGLSEPKFSKQIEIMSDSVKKGEFGRRFQKRQEKLE